MRYYINNNGSYYGASNRTMALQEVPFAPLNGNQIWNGEGWDDAPDTRSYREKRLEAYKALGDNAIGDFMDDLSKALDGNDLIAGTDLQARIDSFNAVKAQFPKGEEDDATQTDEAGEPEDLN